jgi:transposase
MTDRQWALIAPLLPSPGNTRGVAGRRKHRLALDAIFYEVRGGIPWRQLPRELPPLITVYGIYRRWGP